MGHLKLQGSEFEMFFSSRRYIFFFAQIEGTYKIQVSAKFGKAGVPDNIQDQ